jgi:hypothetical protein
MGKRRFTTMSVGARNRPKRRSTKVPAEFDARAYFFATVRWFNRWPQRAIEQFEEAGFTCIRLEHIEPHPVWRLRMRAPAESLIIGQAGRMIRNVVEQAGHVPRDAFFCHSPRRGVVEATFVLEV